MRERDPGDLADLDAGDPDLLADAKQMGLDVDPISGEALQAKLAAIYASPPEILRKTREAIRLKR